MKHATQGDFGRPETAVCREDASCDKWAILNDLTTASANLDLSHTTLGVLKALLSFLPSRTIGTSPRGNTVFPANRTLCHRLNGMPDSTLRRHLSKLVALGLVSRHDSPNRKRYARNLGRTGEVAFGFDLTPLALMADQITHLASEAKQEMEALRALREEVAILRQDVLANIGLCGLTENAHRILRRKPCRDALSAIKRDLEALIEGNATPRMSGTDSQNERHIHVNSKYIPEKKPKAFPKKQTADTVTLGEVVTTFTAVSDFFPDAINSWQDLCHVAHRISPMIGLEKNVWCDAVRSLGEEAVSIVVLFMLENITQIENPSGYLRRIVQNEGGNGKDLVARLMKQRKPAKLSADNQKICYESVA